MWEELRVTCSLHNLQQKEKKTHLRWGYKLLCEHTLCFEMILKDEFFCKIKEKKWFISNFTKLEHAAVKKTPAALLEFIFSLCTVFPWKSAAAFTKTFMIWVQCLFEGGVCLKCCLFFLTTNRNFTLKSRIKCTLLCLAAPIKLYSFKLQPVALAKA